MYVHSALDNEETSGVLVWLVGLSFNKLVIFHDRLGDLETQFHPQEGMLKKR